MMKKYNFIQEGFIGGIAGAYVSHKLINSFFKIKDFLLKENEKLDAKATAELLKKYESMKSEILTEFRSAAKCNENIIKILDSKPKNQIKKLFDFNPQHNSITIEYYSCGDYSVRKDWESADIDNEKEMRWLYSTILDQFRSIQYAIKKIIKDDKEFKDALKWRIKYNMTIGRDAVRGLIDAAATAGGGYAGWKLGSKLKDKIHKK